MNPKNIAFIIGGIFAVAAFLFLTRTTAQKEADIEAGFTDIPGPIDEIAAATNRLSGGLLSRFGSFLGETVSGFTDTRTVDELTGTVPDELAPEQTADFVGPPSPEPVAFAGPPRIG